MINHFYYRTIAFISTFVFCASWEIIFPRRTLLIAKSKRWFINISIILIDNLTIMTIPLIIPIVSTGATLWATTHNIGLFNLLKIPNYLAIFIAIGILDIAIYFQHVYFHRISFFWKFHLVHHADLDFDITSGLRFHPLEIFFSLLIKIAIILIFGTPYQAVIIFEILLNSTSMFSHSNIFIPLKIDHCLRLLLVTPDMHRIHHSIYPRETNSNFGFNLSIWDRIFKTYISQPKEGHLNMTIGLKQYQQQLSLLKTLLLPFSLFKPKKLA